MARTVRFVMLCALTLWITGCGGSDNGISKKEKARDGRVLVRNATGTLNPDSREVDITVKYTDPSGSTRTTVVSPGQAEDVTGDELIKGGERVHLIIEAVASEGVGSAGGGVFMQTVRIRTFPMHGNTEIRIIRVSTRLL